MPPQPEVHRGLEHRAACARTIALAVNDPYAAASRIAADGEELGQPIARRCLIQAVKIQLGLDRILPAPQAAHHLGRARPPRWNDSAALKPRPALERQRRVQCDQGHHFIEIFGACARHCAARTRLCSRKARGARDLLERFDVAHRRAKLPRRPRRALVRCAQSLCVFFPWIYDRSATLGLERYSIVRTATPASTAQTVNQ